MLRFNFALNKVPIRNTIKNNFGKKYSCSNSRFNPSFTRKNFSSNEASFIASSNRYLPLNIELKLKKAEDISQSISKKLNDTSKNKFNSNVVSLMREINSEKDSSLSIDNLYSKNVAPHFQLEKLNSELNFPNLTEIRQNINSALKDERLNIIKSINESINSMFKLISDNIKKSDNPISLIQDCLTIINFQINLHGPNESQGKIYFKETIISYLNILNSVEFLSIEIFKTVEIFLFQVIENSLQLEDISDSEHKLYLSISTSILKLLEKFGDVIIKFSGENSKEMFQLYFLFANYNIRSHNSNYSKAEEYINKAASIIKNTEVNTTTPVDFLSSVKLSYVLGEIQLNTKKDLKESYVKFSEGFNLINQLSTGDKLPDLFTNEEFQILNFKISQRYSDIFILGKDKLQKVIEISDNMKDGKNKINVEIIKKYPSVFPYYLSYLETISNILSTEGFKQNSYDYLKYIYCLKRDLQMDRIREIDLLSFTFEDSVDFYFLSHLFGQSTKSPSKETLCNDKLRSYTYFLSDLLKDSLETNSNNMSVRILNANVLKNLIDNIQKYKSDNGIVFENEEKFILNHLISSIKLNFLTADCEKATENLNKAIELFSNKNSEKNEKLSDLVNLNCNLFYAMTMNDKNKNIVSCLENLKNTAKTSFESRQDTHSLELLIEANIDLYELFFEQNKVNEGINCLIEASELNKHFEKSNLRKFKLYSNKLKNIREEIKNLKEQVDSQSSDVTEEKGQDNKEHNKNKSSLYGIFSKK